METHHADSKRDYLLALHLQRPARGWKLWGTDRIYLLSHGLLYTALTPQGDGNFMISFAIANASPFPLHSTHPARGLVNWHIVKHSSRMISCYTTNEK
ncbi:hypothetical protein AB0756_39075 [Tolypothrix campylonemoides VB511288_2]|uniref:Uncharacterized protein n=1 Tax=Tolypothrix campylonemoides VB511288_2 TaxID=3232311 RepID=A0ABW8XM50_9CYAN